MATAAHPLSLMRMTLSTGAEIRQIEPRSDPDPTQIYPRSHQIGTRSNPDRTLPRLSPLPPRPDSLLRLLSRVSPSRLSPRSEIFQSDTSDEDALRASVAHLALGDAVRPYHYFMLHFTNTESQATLVVVLVVVVVE